MSSSNGFYFKYSYPDKGGRLITGYSLISIPFETFRKVLDFFTVVVSDSLIDEIEIDEAYLDKFVVLLENMIQQEEKN